MKNSYSWRLSFWRRTGKLGLGNITYAPGQLAKEGPFSNPARMIEAIFGNKPTPKTSAGRWDDRSDSDVHVSVWAHSGWWDKEYRK